MRKLFFTGTFDIADYTNHNIKRSETLFLCNYESDYKEIVQQWLRQCYDDNVNRIVDGKKPYVLEITVQPKTAPRTLKENALMWKIYEIQAEILNKEGKFIKPVTSQELYDEDMKNYAPVHQYKCAANDVKAVIAYAEQGNCEYKGHWVSTELDDDGYALITFRETSSFWDIAKFSDFITSKIEELESMGRDRWNDGEVKSIIDDFKSKLQEYKK